MVIFHLIGYIMGYRKGDGVISELQVRLARLDAEVENCHQSFSLLSVPGPMAAIPDNLKVVEGIGPAIEKLLNAAGILTYAELSGTSALSIKEILDNGGPRFQVHDPDTWPKRPDWLLWATGLN